MFEDLNARVQRLNVLDIGLIKWCMIVIGVIIAKIFPGILQASYVKLIAIAVILGIKPLYVFWIKK
ncbi:hypothetical protein ACFL5Y_02325 [Candidatus Omnitrophota bacterium]